MIVLNQPEDAIENDGLLVIRFGEEHAVLPATRARTSSVQTGGSMFSACVGPGRSFPTVASSAN